MTSPSLDPLRELSLQRLSRIQAYAEGTLMKAMALVFPRLIYRSILEGEEEGARV